MRVAKVLSILYLWTVVLGGVLLLARLFTGIDLDFSVELAVLILIVMASEWLVVSFPHGQLSAAYAITLGAFLLYGPAAAAWVTALGVLFGQGIANRGNPVRTTMFNGAQSVLAVYGAYWVYLLCGGVPYPGSLLTLVNIPALLAFSAGYFLINHLLVYVYLLPRRRVNLVGWRETLSWGASTYLFLVPLGFLVAVVHQEAGFTGAALVLLLSLVLQLFLRRHIRVELNNREMGILYEVARRLGTSAPADGLLDLILRETRQIIPYH
ncbi:MAG: GGDEF domain-containing protein, partial [Candidatus Desulforudis sp.]|nr:GGDEF domain-containing protein [Desulforudis sp.]